MNFINIFFTYTFHVLFICLFVIIIPPKIPTYIHEMIPLQKKKYLTGPRIIQYILKIFHAFWVCKAIHTVPRILKHFAKNIFHKRAAYSSETAASNDSRTACLSIFHVNYPVERREAVKVLPFLKCTHTNTQLICQTKSIRFQCFMAWISITLFAFFL